METEALKALLARLEAATGADRELDGALVMAFGGPPETALPFESDVSWTYRGAAEWVMPSPRSLGLDLIWKGPHLTASIDAALALVERVLPGWGWLMRSPEQGEEGHFARLESPDFDAVCWEAGGKTSWDVLAGSHASGEAPTPALALLIALVKAKIAEAEGV